MSPAFFMVGFVVAFAATFALTWVTVILFGNTPNDNERNNNGQEGTSEAD